MRLLQSSFHLGSFRSGETGASIMLDVMILHTAVRQMLRDNDGFHHRLGVDLLTDMFHYHLKYDAL